MKYFLWHALALLVVTAVLALGYASLFNKHLVINSESGHEIQVGSDAVSNAGTSSVALNRQNEQLTLSCTLDNTGYAYPYCNLNFVLGTATKGLDLTSYENVRLKLSIDGPDNDLRIYLTASRSSSIQMGDEMRKYYSVEIAPSDFNNDITIPLHLFKTAQWWLDAYGKNLFDTEVNLANVLALQISTSSASVPGDYQIRFEQAVFSGKIISRATLYLLIIAMWGLSALVYVVMHWRSTQLQLNESQRRTDQLQQINDALQLQSKTYQQASQRDALTGLYNRAALRERAQNWIERVEQHNDRLSLVLFDIDHFKAINDNHGHDAGDAVLIQLAKYCNEHIRHQDLLVRWGGEEFAIFCPQTELQFAEMLANKIRNGMRSVDWPEGLKVTASFGVSELYVGEPFTEFVNRADQALYFSKQHGRDMVSVTGLD
ncbi:diguanylate cyclase [Neiella marina]|uniref:diguanylate cyclase n=1 Tax=Neiella marina TaxID=508461 RepID=A0A8J2U2E5_9GAMM|nr:GGDEF domain-containing protein [Neiella marina]GGA66691.1 diguanylate cyclase [Neiella marina]